MPKGKKLLHYSPVIRRIWEEVAKNGEYRSGPLTKVEAMSLRLELYSYRSSLDREGESQADRDLWEAILPASISIKLTSGVDHTLIATLAGPAWAQPESLKSILSGLSDDPAQNLDQLLSGLDDETPPSAK